MKSCSSPEDFPKTLVFCKTKRQCVKIFSLFAQASKHKSLVSMYHATLSEETKTFLYCQFTATQSDLRCLVCTIAFGMVSTVGKAVVLYKYTIPVNDFLLIGDRVWM